MLKKDNIDIGGKNPGNDENLGSGGNERDYNGDLTAGHDRTTVCPYCETRISHQEEGNSCYRIECSKCGLIMIRNWYEYASEL